MNKQNPFSTTGKLLIPQNTIFTNQSADKQHRTGLHRIESTFSLPIVSSVPMYFPFPSLLPPQGVSAHNPTPPLPSVPLRSLIETDHLHKIHPHHITHLPCLKHQTVQFFSSSVFLLQIARAPPDSPLANAYH